MELHLRWFHQCLFSKWTTWWGQGEQAGNGNLQGHSCHQGGDQAQKETELKNWTTACFKDSKCYAAPAKHTLHGKTYSYSKPFHFSEEFRLLGFSALAQRFKIRRCYCCSATQSCPTLWPHGLQHPRLLCSPLSPGACSNPFTKGLKYCEPKQHFCRLNLVHKRAIWWYLGNYNL